MNRAIQSATAGTTRDLISAPLTLPGGEVLLTDSAGLLAGDEPAAACTGDDPDELAQAAARQALKTADVILLVIDASEPCHPSDESLLRHLSGRCVCLVGNKIDLLPESQRAAWGMDAPAGCHVAAVSALDGQGFARFRSTLDSLVFTGSKPHGEAILALSNRQRDALREACDALQNAIALCPRAPAAHEPTELIAMEIRSAMNALSHLTGEVMTDDLLARIFARFCVGK
jgi:tRNA modification GTPase